MAEYALLINGSFILVYTSDVKPDDIPHKQVVWLPLVRSKKAGRIGCE